VVSFIRKGQLPKVSVMLKGCNFADLLLRLLGELQSNKWTAVARRSLGIGERIMMLSLKEKGVFTMNSLFFVVVASLELTYESIKCRQVYQRESFYESLLLRLLFCEASLAVFHQHIQPSGKRYPDVECDWLKRDLDVHTWAWRARSDF